MWPFEYPYTNFHELNLDWILKEINNIPAEIRREVAKIKTTDTVKTIFDYGAKGDGSTDDTAAFENALSSGELVFLPHGRYAVSKLKTVGQRVNFIGNNAEIIFTETTGNMWHIEHSKVLLYGLKLTSNSSTNEKLLAIYASSVIINNCEFYGGYQGGLYIHDCAGIDVANCLVHDVINGSGITVYSARYEGGRIVNNIIYNIGYDGIIPSQKGLLVAGNIVHDVGNNAPADAGAGCIYTKDTGNSIHITNNTLYNATYAGVELNTVHDNVVEGNYIFNCAVGISIYTADNNIVNNNVIRNCGNTTDFSETLYGLNCHSDSNNNIISSNVFVQESKHKYAATVQGKNQCYLNIATGYTGDLPFSFGADVFYVENQQGLKLDVHKITLKSMYEGSVPFTEATRFEKALIIPNAQSDKTNAIWSDGQNVYVRTSEGIKHTALTL